MPLVLSQWQLMVQFALLEMQLLMEQMFSLIQYRTLQVEQELRHYICMAEQVLPLRIV